MVRVIVKPARCEIQEESFPSLEGGGGMDIHLYNQGEHYSIIWKNSPLEKGCSLQMYLYIRICTASLTRVCDSKHLADCESSSFILSLYQMYFARPRTCESKPNDPFLTQRVAL